MRREQVAHDDRWRGSARLFHLRANVAAKSENAAAPPSAEPQRKYPRGSSGLVDGERDGRAEDSRHADLVDPSLLRQAFQRLLLRGDERAQMARDGKVVGKPSEWAQRGSPLNRVAHQRFA